MLSTGMLVQQIIVQFFGVMPEFSSVNDLLYEFTLLSGRTMLSACRQQLAAIPSICNHMNINHGYKVNVKPTTKKSLLTIR